MRTTGPGRSFTLSDHPVHDGSDPERDRFVVLSARHRARNNLSADHKAQLHSLLGAIAADQADARPPPAPPAQRARRADRIGRGQHR